MTKPSDNNLQRYLLTIEYDGSPFSGWQIQPDAETVEETLEKAFSLKLQQDIDIAGQGRTDAGVHATGQTAHVDLPVHTEEEMSSLIHGVNNLAGDAIQIKAWRKVEADFHARFHATGRAYTYTICSRWMPLMRHHSWQLNFTPDPELLNTCAAMLTGEHDFAGFSKFNPDNYTTLCTIQQSEFRFEDGGDVIRYHIRANRFLRNMVRRIIGAMISVNTGKISAEDFENLLHNHPEGASAYTAPPEGLVLKKVFYNF